MGEGIKGVGLDFRTNLPQDKGSLLPGDTGYSPWDSMSISPGAPMHSGGSGVVVSLGQVGNRLACVTVPKGIFEYYPPEMKQRNKEMDLARWLELSKTHQVELEKTDRKTKAFFEMVKILAALAVGTDPSLLALTGDGYHIYFTKDNMLIAEVVDTQNTDRADNGEKRVVSSKSRDPNKEARDAKLAENVVKGLFLPVAIVRKLGKAASKTLDAIGNGIEVLWNTSQPVIGPIINTISTALVWIKTTLTPLFAFVRKHTKPNRAREDVTALLKWIGRSIDGLANVFGLKFVGKTLFNALARVVTASLGFVDKVIVRFVVKPLETVLGPFMTWVADTSTAIVDRLMSFLKK